MQGSIHPPIQRCPPLLCPEASLGQALAHWQGCESAWLLLGQGDQVSGVVSARSLLAALARTSVEPPALLDLAETPGAIALGRVTQGDRLWALVQQPAPPPCWVVRDEAGALLGVIEGDGLRHFLLAQLPPFPFYQQDQNQAQAPQESEARLQQQIKNLQRRQEAERRQAFLALRQANEAAQAASRAKSSFLAMISHDIRTPLNAITGMASLLRDEGLPERQREHLEIIHQAAEDLLAMVSDILEFSHLESSRVSLNIASFDLKRCLTDVIRLFLPQAQDGGLLLGLELSPGLPPQIRSDAQRLRQVFSNLLSNAIKFTAAGEISVRASPAPWDKQLLLFEVCDSGIGIAPEALPRLFEPFCQADASIGQRFGGTGLGLSICDRLLAQLGGQIWLQSQGQVGGKPPEAWVAPGAAEASAQGSCFYFTLPQYFNELVSDQQTPSVAEGREGWGDRPPTLSLAVLQEVESCCNDPVFFADLLATYRRDGEQQISDLWTALARQDLDALIYLAHSLGPASATLGGLQLCLLCQGLEAAAQSAQSQLRIAGQLASIAWEHLGEAVQGVELEYEQLCERLCKHLPLPEK